MSVEPTSGEFLERIQKLSPKRLALLAVELERRLAVRKDSASEPIAIIGLGCRMPGDADTPEEFWKLLVNGVDAIEEIPSNRWDVNLFYDPHPDTPGKANTKWGGFVDHIDEFDPAFFGISPREAVQMDPQQRMLLEVSWEALENACVPAESLNGSPTGVFVGMSTNDYASLLSKYDDSLFDAYSGSGIARSVAAGRLSYFLGLKGPNLAIDTACSSSAVAIHIACQSLRQNECRMALAGGVNAILIPQVTITLSQAHMLASDGRCKTFSQSADGFVRSEGCGMIVMKRLSDAQADGDRILGIIRGSAINHDGRSSGLTAPNGPSQEAVVKAALTQAGLRPEDLDYVETHGTGTVLGDAIELGALGSVFGARRTSAPELKIGSVKTNVGHLEAAAGAAGVMKVLLALQHESIPAHLHVSEGHENDALQNLQLSIPLRPTPWPTTKRPRIAGISSFGFSGTNAHIVIEESVAAPIERSEAETAQVISVSAKSKEALLALCSRYAEYLEKHPNVVLADFAFTLNAGRSHFQHRVALLVSTAEDAALQLRQIAERSLDDHSAYRFIAGYEKPSIGFLFSGQGSQYAGMGRELYTRNTVFRNAVDQCDRILSGKLTHRLAAVLCGEANVPADLIHDTAWTQPVLFTFEYALAMLWRSWGVRPSIVLGHSLGEYVAACIAGVFPLEQALTLAYERGRLMGGLPRNGAMLAIRTSEDEAVELIRPWKKISIAAVNGPRSVVASGDSDEIEKLRDLLTTRGIASQPLTVSHAFHSGLMDPMLDEFESVAAKLTYAPPQLALVSNLSGEIHSTSSHVDESYWRKHIRGTVRFSNGFSSLMTQQPAALLEIGPDPVLLNMAKPALAQNPIPSLPSLRRGKDAWQSLYDALRQLYLAGALIDWDQVYRDRPAAKLALPTYPFQRQRYWVAVPDQTPSPNVAPALPLRLSFDPLLYTTVWEIQNRLHENRDAPVISSVLFMDESGESASLCSGLEAAGIVVHKLPDAAHEIRNGGSSLDPAWKAQIELLRTRLRHERRAPSLVMVLPQASPGQSIPDAALENAVRVLDLLQTVTEEKPEQLSIWLLTRQAVPLEDDASINLSASVIDAMVKTARLEHSELSIQCVDLPQRPSDADITRFTQLIREGTSESCLAIREGKLIVPRLSPLSAVSSRDQMPCHFTLGATYLVTGAYGGLGFRTVQWMIKRGAKSILMVGRHKPSQEVSDRLLKLRESGIQIHDLVADISEHDDVDRVFSYIGENKLDLRGIVHTAGTIDDGTLLQQDQSRFAKVFAPKAQGSWLLHEASRGYSLNFFVMFGSAASVLGSAGQCNYAAANGFLDALSHARRREGLPSTTIAWGAWSEIGMATRVKDTGRAARLGLSALSPEKGIELLEQAIGSGHPDVAALSIDWRVYLAAGQAQSHWPLFEKLAVATTEAQIPARSAETLRYLLESSPAEEHLQLIKQTLRTRIIDVLRLSPNAALRENQPLGELGLDSLMALELKNGLQKELSVTLPGNFFFEYPTLDLAATYVNARLVAAHTEAHPAANSSEYEELAI